MKFIECKFLAAADGGFLESARIEGHPADVEEKSEAGVLLLTLPLMSYCVALGRGEGAEKHFTRLTVDTLVPEALQWEGSRTPRPVRFMTLRNKRGTWNPGCWERCDAG